MADQQVREYNLVMNETVIREYQDSDLEEVAKLMNDFQDYLVLLDPLSRMRRLPEYGLVHTRSMIEEVRTRCGKLLVAVIENKILGFIAGIIKKHEGEDLLDSFPSTDGRITELFVSDECRGKGVGKQLMDRMEEYFKEKGCDVIKVLVFEPNTLAHEFYKKSGYEERLIDLIKKVENKI